MSVPKNHHYIPQVHIKKFRRNESEPYYLLNKDSNSISEIYSSTNIFVVKELNTKISETGQKDHKTFEAKLTKKWDDHFNNHFDSILNIINNSNEVTKKSIQYFFEYSIMCNLRRKKMSSDLNMDYKLFYESINEIFDFSNDTDNFNNNIPESEIEGIHTILSDLESHLINFEKNSQKLRYPNSIPDEVKMLVPNDFVYKIYIADDSSFILPDCCSILLKGEKKIVYYKQDFQEIIFAGIPLSNDIFLKIYKADSFKNLKNEIIIANSRVVKQINQELYKYAEKQVLSDQKDNLVLFNS